MKKIVFGVLVIGAVVSSFSLSHAATYNLTPLNIPYPHSEDIFALGINNSGHIVGTYYESVAANYRYGFVYDGATYTNINYPGTSRSTTLREINNSGQVAGYYSDSDGTFHGLLYDGSSYRTIDNSGYSNTLFYDLNDNGRIIGEVWNNIYNDGGGFSYTVGEGVLYNVNDGTFRIINYPGASSTDLAGINNNGYIIGNYSDSANISHAFMYDGTEFSSINYPGADRTSAMGINNSGQVVGYYNDTSGYHDFLYD